MRSWGDQCSIPCSKNEGPSCHDKWSVVCNRMERVAMSAGFWDEGTWDQWTHEMLYHKTSTLLCTQIFHFLFDCLIHHTAILLSAQQNMFPTRTSNLTALTTESISFDNKTQAKSSKRRILTKVFHWCSSTLSCPQVDFNTKTIDNPYINNCVVCLSKSITYPLISTSLFLQLHRI